MQLSRMGRRSLSPLGGLSGGSNLFGCLTTSLLLVATSAAFVDGFRFPLGLLVATGAIFALAFLSESGSVRREEAWLESLPFSMEGYAEAISGPASASTIVVVIIDFRDEAPDAAQVIEVVGPALHWNLAAADAGRRLESRQVCIDGARQDLLLPTTNASLVRHLHECVDQVLLPLHQRWPIARVRFDA